MPSWTPVPPEVINLDKAIRIVDVDVLCDWPIFCTQLLSQWPRLTLPELNNTKHNRHQVAMLVQQKYNITSQMIENYLWNIERTMPLH